MIIKSCNLFQVSLKKICEQCKIAVSTFHRWRNRIDSSKSPVEVPGPKQLGPPINLDLLRSEMLDLNHCKKRTHGSGDLYEKYSDSISRRDFARLLEEIRDDVKHQRFSMQCIVESFVPGAIWIMDATCVGRNKYGKKEYLHTVQDMKSIYKFEPVCSTSIKGKVVVKTS